MGKFDWLKPKPNPTNGLRVYTQPAVNGARVSILEQSTGWSTERYTDANGFCEFTFNDQQSWIGRVKIEASGYEIFEFDYRFEVGVIGSVRAQLVIIVPEPVPDPFYDWGWSNPESENVDSNILAELKESWFEDAVLIRNNNIIWHRGNIDVQQTNLASVCRVFLNLLWGAWYLQHGGMAWLDRNVSELPSDHARGNDFPLRYLNSYTAPDGQHFEYSDGKYWPLQHRIQEDLWGKSVQSSMMEQVLNHLGGTTFGCDRTSDDQTNRIFGSIRDIARFALLMFNKGNFNGYQICEQDYIVRSLAGGPSGNGIPEPREGYQTHLVKNQSAWEDDYDMVMTGVPDDCFMARSAKSYIIGIPSLNLIMAGKGPEQFQDVFLPTVVRAFR